MGVALDSLADAEILFRDIPLDRISTSWTVNGTAAIMLAFYVAVGGKQGVPRCKLRGTVQNDILKEYVARGTWIWPPAPSIRLIADSIEFCAEEVPRYNAVLGRGRALPRRGRERGPGDGIHPSGRGHLLRRDRRAGPDDHRPVRAAGLLLLLHAQRLLRGGRQVPRRPPALGADRARPVRRAGGELLDVPVRRGLRRLDAPGPAAPEQHRAGRLPGDGGGARWRAVDVHRGVGRAVRAADRGEHHPRAAHPADPGPRDRRHPHRRPVGRVLLRRSAHRRDGGEDRRDHGRPRGARRDGPVHRGRVRAAAHRRRVGRGPAEGRPGRAGDRRREQVRERPARADAAATRDGRGGPEAPARPPGRGAPHPQQPAPRWTRSPACARPRSATPT